MISFLAGKFLGLMGAKGWIVGLLVLMLAANLTTGKLLINAYKETGKQEASVEQWKAANAISILAYQNLEKSGIERERKYSLARKALGEDKTKLNGINDEANCIDSAMPLDLRMLFVSGKASTDNSRLPQQ